MNFDIFPSVSAPGQLCTRELLEKAICNDALTPLYEAIAAAEGDKRQELKRRLPGVTWQAHFPDGRRRNGTGEWSSLYMVDVDHVDDPAAIWKALEPRTAELGIVVAHVTPSRKGLRLVCRCRKGLTSIAANQAWLAEQTGLEIDAATKDQARLSYLVPASYFFLLDEAIWEAKEGLENLENLEKLEKIQPLLNLYSNLLQILVSARGTYGNLIVARHYSHRVGGRVPSLELLAGQVDADSLFLSSLQPYLLVGTQCLEGPFGISDASYI